MSPHQEEDGLIHAWCMHNCGWDDHFQDEPSAKSALEQHYIQQHWSP
jgi:hypothetical protein